MTKLVKIFFNSSSIASNTYIDKLFFDTKITDSFEGVTEYTYDALGQLITEIKDGEVIIYRQGEIVI